MKIPPNMAICRAMGRDLKSKILIVVHQERSTPGRVGMMLAQRGYELDIRRPPLGDALPDTLEGYAGTVVFGGPMSANDDDSIDGIRREIDWIKVPLEEKVPYLGLCLGGQLLARHLGAKVSFHSECEAEIGYYPIEATRKAIEWFGDWPSHVYQWHREGFEVPHGAELLARGCGSFPNQAFAFGDTAIGLQFHPEVTLAMTHRWTVLAAERFSLPGVRPRHSHFSDRLRYDAAVVDWLGRLLDRWLASGNKATRKVA